MKVEWFLRSPATTNGERDQEVGTIGLDFELVNTENPTPTTCLNKELFKNFHSVYFGDASDNATFDYSSGSSNNLDYYVEVVEAKEDESSNMFLLSSKVIQNRSKIRYNRLKVVPDQKEGKAFCKIGSLTEDKVRLWTIFFLGNYEKGFGPIRFNNIIRRLIWTIHLRFTLLDRGHGSS